jgi:hypothetical protein
MRHKRIVKIGITVLVVSGTLAGGIYYLVTKDPTPIHLTRAALSTCGRAKAIPAISISQIPISEWLMPFVLKKAPIVGPNWRRDLDHVKEAAGLVRRETARSEKTVPKIKKGKIVQARRY